MRRRSFLVGGLAAGLAAPLAAVTTNDFGRMLITGFRGTRPGDPEVDAVRRYLSQGAAAGVILLGRNLISPEQVAALTRALREATPGPPPIISIDQEGGRVARLAATNGFRPWMSAAAVAASGMNEEEIIAYYVERARELSIVGINLNLAPVVDLNLNPFNPIIGRLGRSYGRTIEAVVRHAGLFIRAHHAEGVLTALKHFPGHGSATADSHRGTVDVSDTWSESEEDPFRLLSGQGLADAIMTAHLLHPRLSDGPGIPSSLSRRTVDRIRNAVGFDGPVIADDMQMGAVAGTLSMAEGAVRAINAGNSLLIYANFSPADRIETVRSVAKALELAGKRVDRAATIEQGGKTTALRWRLA